MTTFLIFLFLSVALLQIIVIQNLTEYSDSQKHVCAEAHPKTHTTYIHKEKNTAERTPDAGRNRQQAAGPSTGQTPKTSGNAPANEQSSKEPPCKDAPNP